MTNKQISTMYLTAFGLMLLAGGWGYWHGKSGIEIFHNILFCPVYLLSAYGISALFPADEASSRSFLRELQRHFLDSIVIGSFVIMVVLPKSSGTAMDQLQFLTIFLAVSIPLRFAFFKRKPKTS